MICDDTLANLLDARKELMKRNLLALASLLAVLSLSAEAFAQSSVADDVVARLQSSGYTISNVRKSWLGRIVVTASNETLEREIVLNRTSGEVIRDQTFEITPETRNNPERRPNSGADKQGPKGSGGPEGNETGGDGHGGNG
jgi:hypothetical protein